MQTYQKQRLGFCTKVQVGSFFETSLGRALVGAVLPAALPFSLVDEPLNARLGRQAV